MAFEIPSTNELTQVQARIYRAIGQTKRIAVIGGPGTGKTVLAILAANGSNKRALFLTYSRPLSELISKHGRRMSVSTCHSWIFWFAKSIWGEEVAKQYTKDYQIQWEAIISAYKKLNESAREENRYDTVFVDEGQDLPDGFYRFLSLIADKVFVTFDDAQEVGNEGANRPEGGPLNIDLDFQRNRILNALGMQEDFYDLIENFRNTRQIERVAKLFYTNYEINDFTLRMETSVSDGPLPKVYVGENKDKIVRMILNDMRNDLSASCAILVPSNREYDEWMELLQREFSQDEALKKYFYYKLSKNTNISEDNVGEPGLFLMTMRASKGLEFDSVYVIVSDNTMLNTNSEKNAFYVALTRARSNLSLVFEHRNKSAVWKIIDENEAFFDFAHAEDGKAEMLI